MQSITFTGRDFTVTDKLKEYCTEKISKFEHQLEKATKINVEMSSIQSKGDGLQSFRLEITIFMPKAVIRVEERGTDMYAMIDKAEVVLRRRLKRYHDRLNSFERAVPWKVIEAEDAERTMQVSEDMDYSLNWTDFVPKVVKHKEYSDNTPMHIAEAIERMELLGRLSFLFRNIESGKYAMVYKRDDGTYGLVEPKEG